MNTILKTRIIKIGNSQGVRIPKGSLEQAGLGTEVELDVQLNQIVIRPAHPRRHHWDQLFETMAAQGADVLLDQVTATDWDEKEWEW
jgi:antitoxin MazE